MESPVRVSGAFVFSVGVAALAAWALLQTPGWPVQAWLYPRFVAIPLLVLAVVESVLTLRGGGAPVAGHAMDIALSTSVAPDVAARRTRVLVAWIGGFFLAVIVLGFQPAVPLFVFGYLYRYGRERWPVSVGFAALAALVFHLLFVNLLHLPLPIGLLWRVLGR
jgi:hypothetical protein